MEPTPQTHVPTEKEKVGCFSALIKLVAAVALIGYAIYAFIKASH